MRIKQQTTNNCVFPNCSRSVYPGSNYCGITHRDKCESNNCNNNKNHGFKICQQCYLKTTAKMCKNCTINSVYPGFDFCSRTCGINYSNKAKMCKNCNIRQVFQNYDYCGRTCANLFNQSSRVFTTSNTYVGLNAAFLDFKSNNSTFDVTKYVKTHTANQQNFTGVCFYDMKIYVEFFPLCNFYDSVIIWNGRQYNSVETAYQAHKFLNNSQLFNQFTASTKPGDAFRLANQNNNLVPIKFHSTKHIVMESLLIQKFKKGSELANFLKATKNQPLFEITTNDTTWGIGSNGNGKNLLGKLLEKIRSSL